MFNFTSFHDNLVYNIILKDEFYLQKKNRETVVRSVQLISF